MFQIIDSQLSAILGIVHGFDYLFTSLLLGSTIFYFLIAPAGGPRAIELLARWPRQVRVLLILTFVSSSLWLLLASREMADSWNLDDLKLAFTQTHFAHLWLLKLASLFVLLVSSVKLHGTKTGGVVFLGVVILLPLISILTGHAAAQENLVAVRILIDYSHALAVSTWTGGLWILNFWLGKRLQQKNVEPMMSFNVVQRFSHFAMGSTGVIVVTGLLMTYLAQVSFLRPWETSYGLMVMAKVFLLGLALLAAAVNQFLHMRNWHPEGEKIFASSVRREAAIELTLAIVVFFVAGFLARTALPGQ